MSEAGSLWRWLLQRLRPSRPNDGPAAEVYDILPDPPSPECLAETIAEVAAGRAEGAERLALFFLALDRQGDEAGLAEAARRLVTCDPRVWPALDAAARRSWWHAPAWSAAALRRVDEQPGVMGLVVASFHPDGHVREAATARLAELGDAVVLPALALRAADWVAQVRNRARIAVSNRLSDSLVQSLPGLAGVALTLDARREGRWLADQIRALFESAPPELLNFGLGAEDRRIRRVAYTAALNSGRLELPPLVRAATHDPDLPIRVQCAYAALTAALDSGEMDAVRPLLAGGAAAVRAQAVHTFARVGDITVVVDALSDPSPSVRAVAQAALGRANVNAADHYRRLLQGQPPPAGALAGLGEMGAADDVPLVVAWLTHPRPRARAEAVRALRRLGAATPGLVGAMLNDPSPAVARQVTTALKPQAGQFDPAWLAARLAAGSPRHVRFGAYQLLRARDTWTRILTDLELVDDDLLDLRNRARNDISNWLRHEAATTYSMPPPATAEKLREQLAAKASILGPAQVRLLRFHAGVDRLARD